MQMAAKSSSPDKSALKNKANARQVNMNGFLLCCLDRVFEEMLANNYTDENSHKQASHVFNLF